MTPLRSDPTLYARTVGSLLRGLSGTYADDMLRAGDSGFRTVSKGTSAKFEMVDNEQPPCTFTGFASFLISKKTSLSTNLHTYIS